MATDITLPIQPVMGTQRVWTRRKWTDDWTPRPGLRCTSMKFCTIPQIGVASLHWIVGRVSLPGEATSFYREPLDIEHYFVKIEYIPYEATSEAEILYWYGTVEEVHEKRGDRLNNAGTIVAGKKQQFTCHELTALLARTPIVEGWFDDGGVAKKIGMAPVFNEGGIGNRSETKVDGVYLFAKDRTVTTPDGTTKNAKFWSSKDIVEYVLKYFEPKTGSGSPVFAQFREGITLDTEDGRDKLVHSWDQPIFDPHGKYTNDVLGMLFDQRAGMGAFLRPVVDVATYFESMVLSPFTYCHQDVTLSTEGEKTVKANLWQYNIRTDGQPGLQIDLKRSSNDVYHQVKAQGARRQAVGTFCFDDKSLDKNWPFDLGLKYDQGASLASNYNTPDSDTNRRTRNAKVRNSDELAAVYARFKIPDGWDGMVKGGNPLAEAQPLLVDDEDGSKVFGNWSWDRNIMPLLPMREGEDYFSLAAISQNWEEPVAYRRPMVFLEDNTNAGHWSQIDVNGMAAGSNESGENRKFSCSVHSERKAGLSQSTPGLRLTVHNQPQHVLGGGDFVPLPVDEAITMYSWKKMMVTAAIEEARYCEAKWPANVSPAIPAVRVKIVNCGDAFQRNYMAPETVIGLDSATGGLRRNVFGGFIRDDEKKLEEIARALFEFYSRPRIALGLTKKGGTKALWLGDMVHQLGATTDPPNLIDETNSVVTEITLVLPQSGEVPTQHWTTNRGELDHVPIRMAGK